MKVKRVDIRNLKNVFDKIKLSDKISIKLGLILYKNSKKIDEELRFISEELPRFISEDTREFERKKEEIMLSYSRRDENGNPIMVAGNYSFEPEGFRKVGEEIDKYFSSLPDEVKEKIQNELDEVRKFFEEEIEIDLEPLDESLIPDGVLNFNDIQILADSGCFLSVEGNKG